MRYRSLVTVLALLISGLVAAPVGAQVNPFADDEEEEEKAEKKAEKSDSKKKKSDKSDDEEEPEEKDASDDESAEEAAEEEAAAQEAAAKEAAAKAEAEEKAAADEAKKAKKQAAKEASRVERVELSRNFGKTELITTGIVLPVGLGLAIAGPKLFGEPPASMTSPQLDSIDYRISIASHGDLVEGTPFMFGVFDIGGIAYPSLLGGFYLLSGMYYWAADEPFLASQSVNFDHSMVGMAQTVAWTALTAGVLRSLIGRQRPYAAFGRTAYGTEDQAGANLSFFSTTAALSFAMSSFAARDYGTWAKRRGASVVTGVLLPHAVLYGISGLIGYSSIYGQEHFFSDVAIAALVGSLIGNLSYVAHFDRDGNPRTRFLDESATLGPTLLTDPSGESSSLGLGFTQRW